MSGHCSHSGCCRLLSATASPHGWGAHLGPCSPTMKGVTRPHRGDGRQAFISGKLGCSCHFCVCFCNVPQAHIQFSWMGLG